MLDFTHRKVTMAVLTLILMSTVLGAIHYQRDQNRSMEGADLLECLVGSMADMSEVNGDASLTVGGEGSDVVLPSQLNGRPYHIEIFTNILTLYIEDENLQVMDLKRPVHPWGVVNPQRLGQLDRVDGICTSLVAYPHEGFTIQRHPIPGTSKVETFVHVREENRARSAVEGLVRTIEDNAPAPYERYNSLLVKHCALNDMVVMNGLVVSKEEGCSFVGFFQKTHLWYHEELLTRDISPTKLDDHDDIRPNTLHLKEGDTVELRWVDMTNPDCDDIVTDDTSLPSGLVVHYTAFFINPPKAS